MTSRIAVVAALVLSSVLSATPTPASELLGTGYITAGGPWVGFRSVTVVLDRDSVDGFFLDLSEDLWGRSLSATGFGYGSAVPYALSMNFHGSVPGALGRNWLGGCVSTAADGDGNVDRSADVHGCRVPDGAASVEVTAFWGAALDVAVTVDP